MASSPWPPPVRSFLWSLVSWASSGPPLDQERLSRPPLRSFAASTGPLLRAPSLLPAARSSSPRTCYRIPASRWRKAGQRIGR
uniref:Uncharacterized protein n=1 Tax=Arundo donax TaxID=35708 RepID=A0A0A9GKA4_ARUDO